MTYEKPTYATISDIDDDPTVIIDGHTIINAENEYDTEELFRYAVSQGCSDIHMKPGSPPKLRIHGELEPIRGLRRLTSTDTDLIRQDVMSDADQGAFVNRIYDHVFAYELIKVARFRMIVTKSMGMITLNARKLVDTPPSFDDLGTPATIRDLSNFMSGLILVAGITGSGKSTLMAAMIREINATKKLNIISLEDPVEILHSDILSNIIQRNIGTDLLSFTDGVRDAMRQDPDVILIGEIRDEETAQAALKAAETGHLVISTIHSKAAVSVIGRMLDHFEGDGSASARNRLADVLRGIVVQKLVRSTAENGQLVPVNEILLNTDEVKRAIEESAPPTKMREILEASRETGMQTFEQDFQQLVAANVVTEQVALAQASEPAQMKELLDELKPKVEASPMNRLFPPTAPTAPAVPLLKQPGKAKPFSEVVKQKEEESGVVVKPSSAAPDSLPKPIRPNIYVPQG